MCSLMTPCNRTLWYGQYTRGLSTPQYGVRSLNTFTSAAPRTYSIICISSESCLGSRVGFARLLCLLPYVPFYRLRWPRENYCDCAPVHLSKHLSRES